MDIDTYCSTAYLDPSNSIVCSWWGKLDVNHVEEILLKKMAATTKPVKPVRITVDLKEQLHRELKIYCAENAVDIATLIRAMLAARFRQANQTRSRIKKPEGSEGFRP